MASFFSQYKTLCMVEVCTADVDPEQSALRAIHSLDDSIRAEFQGTIQMYEQGLLHSVEFVQALRMILERSRN